MRDKPGAGMTLGAPLLTVTVCAGLLLTLCQLSADRAETRGAALVQQLTRRLQLEGRPPARLAALAVDAAPPPCSPPPAPAAPPRDCQLDVENSPLARRCHLLRNVCFDQERLILYDPAHAPTRRNGPPLDLPTLKPHSRHRSYHFPYFHGGHAELEADLPPIEVRPASRQEARGYLAAPTFSTCTVPIVSWQRYDFNFVHVFRDNAAMMYSALAETPWAPHARLLLMTGGGLALGNMSRALWQPLSPLRLESWADASTRLLDGQIGTPAGAPPDALPASVEGGERRCFAAFYACTKDVPHDQYRLHEYGRYLVRYYRQHTPSELDAARLAMLEAAAAAAEASGALERAAKLRALPPPPQPETALRSLAEAASGGGPAGEVTLRVVFQRRGGTDRLLLNAGELVEACNGWSTVAPSGAAVRFLCWEAELPNLAAGLAAAQEADIFVGIHGANTANAWMMRPGGSLLELTMHGFEESCEDHACPHSNVPKRNAKDPETQLAVWKLLLCDAQGSWQPSDWEAKERKKGKTHDEGWAKYRNSIVRWEALRTMLAAVVETAGDMGQYWRRWQEGTWWWLSTANATVPAGPDSFITCSRARERGMID